MSFFTFFSFSLLLQLNEKIYVLSHYISISNCIEAQHFSVTKEKRIKSKLEIEGLSWGKEVIMIWYSIFTI